MVSAEGVILATVAPVAWQSGPWGLSALDQDEKDFEEAGRRCRLILDDGVEALAEQLMRERRGDV